MYIFLKVIHVAAVVAFLGNISTGVFWKAWADRTGKADVIAHTMRGIIASDRFITIPSIVVLFSAGIGAATSANIPMLHTGWIFWSLVLFTISGIAFMPLSRAQMSLVSIAQTGMTSAEDRDRYHRASRAWALWGAIALGAPLVVLVLMIAKPAIPGLYH
jgi:uncharacterized membrane protein